ncbi:DUF3558 family protein [Amycolatopsis sp. PS_44_ISF1]|uniref:DUF3558 family protein n=1 Tax=Amycolatopsis sp. PS_44_ISF1 TaxID=2974917 RepID=UPI0028DD562D|nr:DUF3558 family protein [Amycolatopsis sp. PS_44_ISF1]MDT8911195.1 DUF3558 family protein [Amycolatopsis sp. PS_44_ISF1]
MRAHPVALLLAAAVLTACSSGDQPAAAPSKPAPSKPASSPAPAKPEPDPCALLSASEVGRAIDLPGVTSEKGPEQANAASGGQARSCEYLVGGKQAGALAVTRYEGRRARPADMIAAIKKAKPGAVDVPGFPGGAVYYLDGRKTATLAAAKLSAGVPTLANYTGPAKMTQEMMTPLVKTAITAA